jgi:hypothetical protein
MNCVEELTTIPSLAGDGNELSMAEAATTTISRRSTRLWAGDGERLGTTLLPGNAYEPRYGSSSSDDSSDMSSEGMRPTLSSLDLGMMAVADIGIDLNGMLDANGEDMSRQGMSSLCFIQVKGLTHTTAANSLHAAGTVCNPTLDGRPINFGAVLPGAVYRSSFPMPENVPFLGTLGLKTVL